MLWRCFCRGFRFWRVVWAGLMVALTVAGLVAAEKSISDGAANSRPSGSVRGEDGSVDQPGGRRLREGTELVDQVGHFEVSNQRLVFVADRGKLRLLGLENLNLERVARSVAGYSGQLNWKICGTVTEYRGTNYLLLRRAAVSTAPPAQP